MKCYELQNEDEWKIGDIMIEVYAIRLITKSGNMCIRRENRKLYHSGIFSPNADSAGYCTSRKASK